LAEKRFIYPFSLHKNKECDDLRSNLLHAFLILTKAKFNKGIFWLDIL